MILHMVLMMLASAGSTCRLSAYLRAYNSVDTSMSFLLRAFAEASSMRIAGGCMQRNSIMLWAECRFPAHT